MAIRKGKQFLTEDESEINILTDSSLVKEQVEGNWNCNYKHLLVIRDRIREELDSNITISHVPRNIIFQHLGH